MGNGLKGVDAYVRSLFLAEGFDGLRAEQSAGPTVLRGLWIEGDGAEPRPYGLKGVVD